jgi:hypothetical protein
LNANQISESKKPNQLFGKLIPTKGLPNNVFKLHNDDESDDASVKSMMQVRDLPSQFDKENNYYMLYWKTYLENE